MALTGNGAIPDEADPALMNRWTWYQTHSWTTPYPGDSKARTFDGQAGQNDGAAVADGIAGERPIDDVAPQLRWKRNPLRRDEPRNPALSCEFDLRGRVVERAGRRGQHTRVDMVGP